MRKTIKIIGNAIELPNGKIVRANDFIVEIDRFFPSSKTCHSCFFVADKMPLSERKWTCPQCGIEHDRDVNASKVILQQGLAYSLRGDLERVSARRESPLSVKRNQA